MAFLSRRQQPSETIVGYGSALNELASACNYGSCCRDRLVRDSFISGLRSPKIMTSLISELENKTFTEVLEKAKVIDQIQSDIVEINPSAQTYQQNAVKDSQNFHKSGRHETTEKNGQKRFQKHEKVSCNYKCSRCGAKGAHHNSECWALKVECRKCSLHGHVAKMCRTSNQRNRQEKRLIMLKMIKNSRKNLILRNI